MALRCSAAVERARPKCLHDPVITIGNEITEAPMGMPCRHFEHQSYSNCCYPARIPLCLMEPSWTDDLHGSLLCKTIFSSASRSVLLLLLSCTAAC